MDLIIKSSHKYSSHIPTSKHSNKYSSLTNFMIVVSLICSFSLSAFVYGQPDSFWYINVANYLNTSEATQELNRLNALGFRGKIVDISENGTAFSQVRVGCFLNEVTAMSYLTPLKAQLIYPSLSSTAKSDTPSTPFCLGYDTAIELPEDWQIVRDDDIFLLSVTLLDYVRLTGFNGEVWRTFQTEADIPEDWQRLAESSTNQDSTLNLHSNLYSNLHLNLQCETTQAKTINCSIADYTFTLVVNGEMLWQHGNRAIFKEGSSLNVLQVLSF